MLINAYNFGRAAGSNIAVLRQQIGPVKITNASTNASSQLVTVNAGSTLITVIHHMMLNGNNDIGIVSDSIQATGHAQQVKSICGSAAAAAKRGSVEIHSSDTYTSDPASLNGPQGTITVFVKSGDANIANIRMHYYIMEVSNLVNSAIVTTDAFATNTGTGTLGNTKPNVFISSISQKNTFIIAAATGLEANQFSFNTCTYPASGASWVGIDNKNEASGTGTGNVRSISNYLISSSNAGTLVSDWGTSFNSAPWAAVIVAFKTT